MTLDPGKVWATYMLAILSTPYVLCCVFVAVCKWRDGNGDAMSHRLG